jgi:hypothetical protein
LDSVFFFPFFLLLFLNRSASTIGVCSSSGYVLKGMFLLAGLGFGVIMGGVVGMMA